MPRMITSVRERLNRRIAYKRTISELSALTPAGKRDLGIEAGDVREFAHRAIYGN